MNINEEMIKRQYAVRDVSHPSDELGKGKTSVSCVVCFSNFLCELATSEETNAMAVHT